MFSFNRINNRIAVMVGLLVTILVACSPVPTPTPPGPTFTGRLIVQVSFPSQVLYVLTSDAANMKVEDLRIAVGVDRASVSPDKHYLLYTTMKTWRAAFDSTRLHDLLTGRERTLMSYVIGPCNWTLDSAMFSYALDLGIYTYDLSTEESKLIFQSTAAAEYVQGSPVDALNPLAPTRTVRAGIGCGGWIGKDDNLYLFQRFEGAFPASISSPVVPPNTTTLAVLGGTPTLTDARQKWIVEDVCTNGSFVLLVDREGQPHITPAFRDFDSLRPRRLPQLAREAEWWRFMPDSCEVYFVIDDEVELPEGVIYKEPESRHIHFMDPETLEVRLGPMLSTSMLSNFWDRRFIWVGDPKEGVIAFVETDEGEKYVSVGNLKTGEKSRLLKVDEYNPQISILAWLPE